MIVGTTICGLNRSNRAPGSSTTNRHRSRYGIISSLILPNNCENRMAAIGALECDVVAISIADLSFPSRHRKPVIVGICEASQAFADLISLELHRLENVYPAFRNNAASGGSVSFSEYGRP